MPQLFNLFFIRGSLMSLRLEKNVISHLPEDYFDSCTELAYLHLSYNLFTALPNLSPLKNLFNVITYRPFLSKSIVLLLGLIHLPIRNCVLQRGSFCYWIFVQLSICQNQGGSRKIDVKLCPMGHNCTFRPAGHNFGQVNESNLRNNMILASKKNQDLC